MVVTSAAARAEGWTRITVAEPVARASVLSALDGAVQWFAETRCQSVLAGYTDEQGCPLSERLAALGTTFERYLQWVVFKDASGTKMCSASNVFAFTAAGSRVVFVCGQAFKKLWLREPGRAKAVLIHEVLHTLGLGENGRHPTSVEITRRVLALCQP